MKIKKSNKIKSKKYFDKFAKYKKLLKNLSLSSHYDHTIETSFESLNDWSLFFSLKEIENWFKNKRKKLKFSIKEINIKDMKKWKINKKTGNISHISRDFFLIKGLRIETKNRETKAGWDQPIIKQIGYDGGILGIIRKRFLGVPHYLCEAKIEPGNYGLVQFSPTLQATFANLNKIHKGRKPFFHQYFYGKKILRKSKILFDSWVAEDGGRFYKKRNRAILLELPEFHKIKLPSTNFCWLSLYQIKQLLKKNSWINPHIRGILAHT